MSEDFLDVITSGRVVMSIGSKHSGKSFLMLKFLKYAFKNNLYDRYILVLPSYMIEENDSYKFINGHAKHIFIFDEYSENICSDLMKTQKQKSQKTLFIVDDASSEGLYNIDEHMKKLITSIRHFNTTLWLLAHGSSNIMSPFLRQNVDAILISKITSRRLLEAIYEEYISLHQDYHEKNGLRKFIDDYINLQQSGKYKVMYLNTRNHIMDTKVDTWKF
jgi:hypothetical protein